MTEQQQIAQNYSREHRSYEKRVRPIFLNAVRKNASVALNWIDLNGAVDVPLDLLVQPKDWIRPIQQAYGVVSNLAAKREYYYQKRTKSAIDLLLDVWASLFNDYATNYAYRIMNELAETTRETIRQAIKEGFELKLNGSQLAAYIRKKLMGEISRNRANTIARTESTTASNLGKEQGAKDWFKEQGTTGYKEWIGRNDGRERHTHIVLNDTIVPIDDQYNVGTEKGERPGDPKLSGKERINCRCTQMFLSAERYRRMQANKK